MGIETTFGVCHAVEISHRRRYKAYSLCNRRADNSHHSTTAIQYGCSRGAVIEHEAVVAVVHLQERCADEPHVGPELNEPTLCEAKAIVRIGEADHQLLRNERLGPDRKGGRTRDRGLQLEYHHFLGKRTCNAGDARRNQPFAFPLANLDLLPILLLRGAWRRQRAPRLRSTAGKGTNLCPEYRLCPAPRVSLPR